MKISINTDISVLEFYEYIKNINEYFNSLNKFFGQSILRRGFRFELFQCPDIFNFGYSDFFFLIFEILK